jgi:glyoxylase-like metal-dependent hydrolase (beta-lactamase superfamily II)
MSLPVTGQGFTEVAERLWVARYEQWDVNVTVLEGERGLVVVDTMGSDETVRTMLDDLRRLSRRDVVAVVNTHEHFDHVHGNDRLREEWPGLPVHAHEDAEIPSADVRFASVGVVDLGDRYLELVHPGRGHTGGDLVVRVPDCDVVLAGDLVEESAAPAYGTDCYPLEWPETLDMVVGLLTEASLVVPGHGAPVDRRFVQEQRDDVGTVAETLRDLVTRGVPQAEALASAAWPFPADGLAKAVARAYLQVPRPPTQLPLV